MSSNYRGEEALAAAPIGGLMLRLAVPAVAAQLINMLYNIVDRIYIGHIPVVGKTALTGLGVSFPILAGPHWPPFGWGPATGRGLNRSLEILPPFCWAPPRC